MVGVLWGIGGWHATAWLDFPLFACPPPPPNLTQPRFSSKKAALCSQHDEPSALVPVSAPSPWKCMRRGLSALCARTAAGSELRNMSMSIVLPDPTGPHR